MPLSAKCLIWFTWTAGMSLGLSLVCQRVPKPHEQCLKLCLSSLASNAACHWTIFLTTTSETLIEWICTWQQKLEIHHIILSPQVQKAFLSSSIIESHSSASCCKFQLLVVSFWCKLTRSTSKEHLNTLFSKILPSVLVKMMENYQKWNCHSKRDDDIVILKQK